MIQRLLLGLVLVFGVSAQAEISRGDSERLTAVLAAQSEAQQERYPWRHPRETMSFFGITPGMTVVEVLPGRNWYSSILASYLGSAGTLIGADYPLEMWPNFPFGTKAFIAGRRSWVETWPDQIRELTGDNGATIKALRIGMNSNEMNGTADAVLFIRALHNLSRFEASGQFFSTAMEDTMAVLKPGGVVGVVQHQAPAGQPPASTDGSRGYMDRDALIARIEAAGFEFVAASDINANPADVPSVEDIVWRLPPSLRVSDDDPELRAKYEAIGESNRMTLLFRKPSS